MESRVHDLLKNLAELKVLDEKMWNEVFGEDGNRSLRPNYADFRRQNDVDQQNVLGLLKGLGYPVQEYYITGQAPHGVDHYTIDGQIKKEFGDHVIADSEHSQIFIYVTEEKKDAVYARVQELMGNGTVTLNCGESYPAYLEMDKDDELQIAGIGNWGSAHKWLKDHV